jgi:hypothetical protein
MDNFQNCDSYKERWFAHSERQQKESIEMAQENQKGKLV